MLAGSFTLTRGKTEYLLTYDAIKDRGQRPLYVADDYRFNFTLQNVDETPVNVAGFAFRFVGKHKATDADSTAIFDVAGVIDNAALGQFHFLFSETTVLGPELLLGYFSIIMTSTTGSDSVIAQTYAQTGSSATSIRTSLTEVDHFYDGKQALIVQGTSVALRTIVSYTKLNGAINVAALPFTPVAGDLVIVLSSTTPGTDQETIAAGNIEFLPNMG